MSDKGIVIKSLQKMDDEITTLENAIKAMRFMGGELNEVFLTKKSFYEVSCSWDRCHSMIDILNDYLLAAEQKAKEIAKLHGVLYEIERKKIAPAQQKNSPEEVEHEHKDKSIIPE